MFGRIGTSEVIVVLLILLLIFGGKKLPELAKGLGQAARELKKGFESEPAKKPQSPEEKQ